MIQVAPSILAADFANLGRDCRKVVSPDNPMLHFDVMDGVFVPNISVGLPVLESLKRAIPEAVYDVHLMIVNPEKYIEAFAKAGADYITFHIEASENPVEAARLIRRQGCKAGISLRPGTSLDRILPFLPELDLVLVMSVEPGFGGQAFMPEAVQRIAAVKQEAMKQGCKLEIEVDGGIDLETAPLCRAAGANILVAGSSVFKAADPAAMVEQLKSR